MEKRRPTYDPDEFDGASRCSRPGFDRAGVVEAISSIDRHMFYKSMTTFADHRLWQDVYHVPARDMLLYVKFQADVVTEFTVKSFKEKQDGNG